LGHRARLGRRPSVVSREIDRNGGRANHRAHRTAERAEKAVRRPKRRKSEGNRPLREEIAARRSAPNASRGQHSPEKMPELPGW
jgi:IS30 family transposase